SDRAFKVGLPKSAIFGRRRLRKFVLAAPCPAKFLSFQTSSEGPMLRVALTTIIVLATGLSILFFTGPRVAVDTTITFDPASIGPHPQASPAQREEIAPGLRPDLASEIIWSYPNSRARTPLAIVYIHGFSASKGEIRPVPDMVATAFGANLFY